MSDDGARGCKAHESTASPALYTLLPVQSKNAPLRGARSKGCDGNSKLNFRQHRRDRINRDISHLRSEKCSEDFGQPSSNSFIHSSSLKCRTSYRLLNICLILMLNVICNQFVTYVNCDELYNSVGARAHFTHTWALHIPGGEQVAEQVAADHGMHLRGKVSECITTCRLKFAVCNVSTTIKPKSSSTATAIAISMITTHSILSLNAERFISNNELLLANANKQKTEHKQLQLPSENEKSRRMNEQAKFDAEIVTINNIEIPSFLCFFIESSCTDRDSIFFRRSTNILF